MRLQTANASRSVKRQGILMDSALMCCVLVLLDDEEMGMKRREENDDDGVLSEKAVSEDENASIVHYMRLRTTTQDPRQSHLRFQIQWETNHEKVNEVQNFSLTPRMLECHMSREKLDPGITP